MSAASFYALDAIFPRLLRESPYVTKLAEAADYFFVSLIRDITIWLSARGILSSLWLPRRHRRGVWALPELPV